MIALWIAAALFSGLASTLILYRSARAVASAREPGEDPALGVYRRQLAEIDDLADRGLLRQDEYRSAHAEAARRLLSAADREPESAAAGSSHRLVLAAAVAAPLIAAALYLGVGSPRLPDQPFAKRLASWRAADPATLSPQQLAALLTLVVAKYPNDPTPLFYLARAQAESGDVFSAEHDLRKAVRLAPNRADLWSDLGVLLISQPDNQASPEAIQAFERARALNPADPDARYFLARTKIAAGDVEGGVADWRALIGDLKPDDPRRRAVAEEVAVVEKIHALPPDETQGQPANTQGDQQAFIQSMVDRLAARLKSQPDDPAGWARLIHAYGVLGDAADQAAAFTRAETLFKNRPADLRLIQTAEHPAS